MATTPKKISARKKSPKVKSLLIKGATVITMDDENRVGVMDMRVQKGRIQDIAPRLKAKAGEEQLDAKGLVAIPGFVQIHTHLCQTLFRGQADDMMLLDWLQHRIWPLEGALEEEDMRLSARLTIAELLLSGTTAVLDMGSVRHGDALFESAKKMGLRYTGGKTIMDHGQGYPAGLRESTDEAIKESIRLCEKWHDTAGGRLRYAFSPRFAVSCTDEVLRACVHEARARGALLHTHASENTEEVHLVRERTGLSNVEYLHSIGFTGKDVILAHCIWLNSKERKILQTTGTSVAHCPSSNLKLASGIARIDEYLQQGIHVGLGADGAPCNNHMDAFAEMRQAALIHKIRGGPTAIPAYEALKMATVNGAKALGFEDVGVLAKGYKADITLMDLRAVHTAPTTTDPVSTIVYAARPSDVHTVMVDGKVLVRDGKLLGTRLPTLVKEASTAAERLVARAL